MLTDQLLVVAADAVEAAVSDLETRPSGKAQLRLLAWTVAAAAVHGHLDVLEWIYSLEEEARPPIDGRACECAAAGGHLDVLRWLRARHAPWDENTCGEAAGNGHLDILQWCRRHGCPWDEGVVQRAREGGFEAVATWALQHGCPPPPQPVG